MNIHSLLEDKVLRKGALVATLLGTYLSIQVHKKVKFSRRDISSLVVKGLRQGVQNESIFCNVDSQKSLRNENPRDLEISIRDNCYYFDCHWSIEIT